MKLILTHKRQLVRQSDVRQFVAYIYGPKGNRPVLPVEGYLPGLPTGDPDLDTASLLSQHHGGKAGKGRSVVFSSEYFRDRETAIAHAPAMVKAASAFRLAWAPNSNGLSVVHLTEGRDQYATAAAKDFKVGENKKVSFETERAKKDITGEGDTKTKAKKAK